MVSLEVKQSLGQPASHRLSLYQPVHQYILTTHILFGLTLNTVDLWCPSHTPLQLHDCQEIVGWELSQSTHHVPPHILLVARSAASRDLRLGGACPAPHPSLPLCLTPSLHRPAPALSAPTRHHHASPHQHFSPHTRSATQRVNIYLQTPMDEGGHPSFCVSLLH
ncbi:hypothetical protein E2C01_009854 [Portunus trituberculatus]|uniref:Uncharacterized protein n=1 Tax=Portunus trituberculatus TaxID=210409 RepID=A0A5B7D6U6_PORTR|nr:hypothetical protein [Portunus trituberculatus]